jgi:hypothetical protein
MINMSRNNRRINIRNKFVMNENQTERPSTKDLQTYSEEIFFPVKTNQTKENNSKKVSYLNEIKESSQKAYGYYSSDMSRFNIVDGFLINSTNGTPKIVEVVSIPWTQTIIHNNISFTLGKGLEDNTYEQSRKLIDAIFIPGKNLRSILTRTIILPKKNKSTKSLNNMISEFSQEKEAIRRKDTIPCSNMIEEITKNIEQSNLAANDPAKFYKNWLNDMYVEMVAENNYRLKKILRYKCLRLCRMFELIMNSFKEVD